MATCMVCFDDFSTEKLPRVLGCGHTVCHTCVVRCFANPAGFSCPLDRERANVNFYRGARQFVFNHALLDHLGIELPDENQDVFCQGSQDCQAQAIFYCRICRASFCHSCDAAAHAEPGTASHPRLLLGATDPSKLHCSEHGNWAGTLCLDCEVKICDDCAVLGPHAQHVLVSIEDHVRELVAVAQVEATDSIRSLTQAFHDAHWIATHSTTRIKSPLGPLHVQPTPPTLANLVRASAYLTFDLIRHVGAHPYTATLPTLAALRARMDETARCRDALLAQTEAVTALMHALREERQEALSLFARLARMAMPSFLIDHLAQEVARTDRYFADRPCAAIRSTRVISYGTASWLLIHTPAPTTQSLGMWALSRCLNEGERHALADDRALTLTELCQEAIALDKTNFNAYNGLIYELPPTTVLKLKDGSSWTVADLLLHCIELNPRYCHPYVNLARDMKANATITLRSGEVLTARQLYLRALACEPRYYSALNGLGSILDEGEMIVVNGRSMSNVALILAAIEANDSYYHAYFNLGCVLGMRNVQLSDGVSLNAPKCFLEALRCLPTCPHAMSNLATVCGTWPVELPDGTRISRRDLLVRAHSINASLPYVYQMLAEEVQPDDHIMLAGRPWTRTDLLLKMVELKPAHAPALQLLANEVRRLGRGTTVTLPSGETATYDSLVAMIAQLSARPPA
eukprot:m.206294 g.206294  ORF g.206294 m.206294 type:complete len:690 (+) comp15536_c3_seq2:93-2162(+)